MTSSIILTLSIIISIYLIGLSIFLTLFKKTFFNIFLTLGLSFILGNLYLCNILTILLFLAKLDLGPPLLLMSLISSILLIIISPKKYYKKRILNQLKRNHWILVLIGTLFLVLILPSMFTMLNLWDTKAMWLFKAKSFFLEDNFPNTFYLENIYYSLHKDYPLGFPLLISLFLRTCNVINEQALKIYFISFFINTIFVFVGTLQVLFKKIKIFHKIILVIALFLIQGFTNYADSGYADVPISSIFIATTSSNLLLTKSDNKELIIISFLCALLGLNFKNEGLTFFLLNCIFLIIYLVQRSKLHKKLSTQNIKKGSLLLAVLLFALLPFLYWLIFKKVYGFNNDITSQIILYNSYEYIQRIKMIINYFLQVAGNVKLFGILGLPFITLYLSFTIGFLIRGKRLINYLPTLIILLQILVYLLTFLITPRDLSWHLSTSLDRLIIQILPSLYICVFYYIYLVYFKPRKKTLCESI